ncbi:short chain dehydrogenase [Colletotrichum gloeosporioides Cg-14]|uniref:Short chain dehydrogenase n=1 Tax=Colletotrichum gloeosporioides (strain Cg-14) TaxID=1237896 RepID=T0M4F1_COLGC|nr:short chain dehydrogenase [Colletotrichum gloeosporioides Cg-14]
MADINTNEKLLQELGDNASFHKTDVSSYSEQSKTFQDVWDQYGRIDALLANAGVVDKGSIYILNHRGSDELPPKPNLGCTDVNFKGLVYGTQLAIHFMRKNETPGGSIIATSSNAAVIPHEAAPEYCGAKAGMVGFVRGASRVLKIKENIRINAVLPGVIRTPLLPAGAIAAVPPGCITQLSTVVSAFNKFLDDESLNGEALECSAEDVVPLVYGKSTMSPVPVWDPLFKMMHHENSGLPEAVA